MGSTMIRRGSVYVALVTVCLVSSGGDQSLWAIDPSTGSAVVALQGRADSQVDQSTSASEVFTPLLLDDCGVAMTPEGQVIVRKKPRGLVTGIRVDFENGPLILSVLEPSLRQSPSLRLLPSGSEPQPVEIVAWDPLSGLVFLQPREDDPAPDPAADRADGENAATLMLGDMVAPWGSPIRVLSHWRPGSAALTAGIVSTGTRYDVGMGADVFSTDALVQPNSIGSAVLNDEGRLVGIVAKAGGSAGAAGPSTAISLQTIRQLADYVRDGGRGPLPQARLGVSLEMSSRGVLISSVEGSAAEQAGIEPGDRVVSLDERPVAAPEDVIAAVRAKRPGDSMQLTVERGGESHKLTVNLGERPTSPQP